MLCATKRWRQIVNGDKSVPPWDRLRFEVVKRAADGAVNMIDVFAAIGFLVAQPTSIGHAGRPVVIGNGHRAVTNGDRVGSHFLEEENVANRSAITDEVCSCAKLRETMWADTIEEPANDRTLHFGERVSIRHDRWHITEGFYDTALNEASDA